ncbi:sensor domain-containing phosphodiesterase [Variovorax sp. Root411]|uniref:bifunctional diguanylate cyclase/phosphodiesterase n=1 Tax=Variovorax sp. Root411 TaxID=1736530 RepID=UPI0009EC7130|nr:sensor domain-containing phosphodiesterase [Variovorax sp. Root411]
MRISTSTAESGRRRESERLFALRSTRMLDTPPTENFDRITRLAAELFDVPIALISLLDKDRQWFKARIGLDLPETPREYAFCDYTIRQADVTVVEDALQDDRFASNPLVAGDPGIRFYAGAPLVMPSGHAIGSLCLVDRRPRLFSAKQRKHLKDLSALVLSQIDLYRTAGRVDEVTLLPNQAQMSEDLHDLALRFPEGRYTLALVDILDRNALRDAVLAVGIRPLGVFQRDLSIQLQSLLSAGSRLYCVDDGRFAFLIKREGDASDRFIERLVMVLKQPVASGSLLIELDARVGVVQINLEASEEIDDALRKAMTAVHQARTLGLSRVPYMSEFDIRHQRAYAILRDIPRAIAHDEFHLVFQPKLRVSSGAFEGVEALIRWQHPIFGNIPPTEFIPLAEGTTLIHELTNWVVAAALKELAELHREGFRIAIAVNVSARSLERPQFPKDLETICARYAVSHDMLHIECTEYSGLTAPATLESLRQIRALGMQLSLDDFGAGYSNLTCLENLPFQMLKVDRGLVAHVVANPRAHQLLQGIVSLGHAMGFRMLAEGVETREVFECIVSMGFDHVQGYYLCRPLSASALRKLLRLPPQF